MGRDSWPRDGESDGKNWTRDENSHEVIRPGKIEVNGPAEEDQGNGEDGEDDDPPVLVGDQTFLQQMSFIIFMITHPKKMLKLRIQLFTL